MGCKGEATAVPSYWTASGDRHDFAADQITASLADALAMSIAAEHRCRQAGDDLQRKQQSWNRQFDCTPANLKSKLPQNG